MADLDDFFAKKDRKKKSVKKFATAEEMSKKLDDGKQKSEARPKKERPVQEGEEGGRAGLSTADIVEEKSEEEEEWKEYEEPVKDYTGLKIQVLQGGPAPETQTAAEESAAAEREKTKGPWNKPQQQETAAPPPEPEKPKEVKPASTAYVPPVARQVQRPEPLRRHASKHAPDIHSDDSFPVLGAAAAGLRREGGWSTAAGGGTQQRSTNLRQPLTLGNRFNELQDDS